MQIDRSSADQVIIRLSCDEALVLSDAVSRWDTHGEDQPPTVDHEAERFVFCDMAASFEPVIDEVFNADYGHIVDGARRRVAAHD